MTIIGRSDEDELLLLASDGLWDVLTNQEAVNLAQRCLRRARQRGASRQAATRVAASVLTRAAVDQGSSDNVTVVVVDLSRWGTATLCYVHSCPCLTPNSIPGMGVINTCARLATVIRTETLRIVVYAEL